MNDSLLQFFWKNSSWILSSSSLISFSFLVRSFELFKIWWVCQLGLYKTSFHSRNQDVMIKDFKLEILILLIHSLSNIESSYTKHPVSSPFLYWNEQFLWQTPHVFPIPLLKWAIFATLTNTPCLSYSFTEMSNFCDVESVRWRVTNVLWASEEKEQCMRFQPLFGVLKCLLISLSTLSEI